MRGSRENRGNVIQKVLIQYIRFNAENENVKQRNSLANSNPFDFKTGESKTSIIQQQGR